ncbi:MAG TPA: hypothetical protein VFM52_10440 [Rhodanobacter sp.]|nr:hypothetical protein [Rhodanobacter sp.]
MNMLSSMTAYLQKRSFELPIIEPLPLRRNNDRAAWQAGPTVGLKPDLQ